MAFAEISNQKANEEEDFQHINEIREFLREKEEGIQFK